MNIANSAANERRGSTRESASMQGGNVKMERSCMERSCKKIKNAKEQSHNMERKVNRKMASVIAISYISDIHEISQMSLKYSPTLREYSCTPGQEGLRPLKHGQGLHPADVEDRLQASKLQCPAGRRRTFGLLDREY